MIKQMDIFAQGNVRRDSKFHPLPNWKDSSDLPNSLAYPYNYVPHPIAIEAAKQLQAYLNVPIEGSRQSDDSSNDNSCIVGKMYGVLVVQNEHKEVGFLAAFSGKPNASINPSYFVPPVFDVYDESSFFKEEEKQIVKLNEAIEKLRNDTKREQLENEIMAFQSQRMERLRLEQEKIRNNRNLRSELRKNASNERLHELNEESKREQLLLKKLKKELTRELAEKNCQLEKWKEQELIWKDRRKQLSKNLQDRIFEQYNFLNGQGELKSLKQLFTDTSWSIPPSGSGECAAPKLFHYAFLRNYRPIALAEFWWGASPVSEIRKHTQFYSCCRGKCEPILRHMLHGLKVEANPMNVLAEQAEEPRIMYEDDHVVILDKPSGLLSVPGKIVRKSVLSFVKRRYPHAKGPLIVHRLDQSTSGIMIIALNEYSYASLQQQFIKRTIHKVYLAVISGVPNKKAGEICLPLRVDLEDRPRQLVCEKHGKFALTKWKIYRKNGQNAIIQFEPVTGRTHQLRVHAAHPKGLGIPIVGDELYGIPSDRLYLHAWNITFTHPSTGEKQTVICEPAFI